MGNQGDRIFQLHCNRWGRIHESGKGETEMHRVRYHFSKPSFSLRTFFFMVVLDFEKEMRRVCVLCCDGAEMHVVRLC